MNLAVNLLILVLVVVWIALVWWTYADARRRLDDPVLVATATAASLFPYIGTAIYTILRPPEFLADARERELETKSAELRLRRLSETSCPRCEHPIELSWLRCPECQHRLKDPCRSCGRPVDPRWAICPHCETAVAGAGRSADARQRQRPSRSGERQAAGRQRAAGERPKGQSRTEAKTARPKQRSSQPSEAESRSRQRSAEARQRAGSGEGPQRPDADGEQQRAPRRKPTPRT